MSIDESLGETFDRMLRARGYQNRSEGLRDVLREAIEAWEHEQHGFTDCVASLSYVFNPETRVLAQRLSELQRDHHDLVVTTTQMHLDHHNTMECVMLKGKVMAVRALADQIRAERGVRFGALNVISVDGNDQHAHADAHDHSGHAHLSPRPG